MHKVVKKVLDYLISLGHDKIGYIGGSDDSNETTQDYMDYREIWFREYMKKMKQ